MNKPHYYLNIKYIKQVMKERDINVKQLVEGFDISERMINNYLQGNLPRKIPLIVGAMFCFKLNIGFYEILTTEPPETLK